MLLLKPCAYTGCQVNFVPTRGNQKFCCVEHRNKHYNRYKAFKDVPMTCRLPTCDKSVNKYQSTKPSQFCCDAHRTAYHRLHKNSLNKKTKKINLKLGTCKLPSCQEEFTKKNYNQVFCCDDHRKEFYAPKPKAPKELYNNICQWSGKYFQGPADDIRFINKSAETMFYRAGHTLVNVERGNPDEPIANESYRGSDLGLVVFFCCDFINVDFSYAHFYKTRFINCTFRDCDFTKCTLAKTFFINCEAFGNNVLEGCRILKYHMDPIIPKFKFTNPMKISEGKRQYTSK